jgi:acetoin utilization protein AcuB
MLVRECMTPSPVTVKPDTTVHRALRLMRERKVGRFPVVDDHGKLVGIVSHDDLLSSSPSPATTLAVWEIPELLAKIKVETVMSRQVITVSEDTPLEEAARIMADQKIGGLPVMREKTLSGIITENDLFKVLMELLGGRRAGVRVTVSIPWVKGTLAKITSAVFGVGGDILGFGIREVPNDSSRTWEIILKVQDVPKDRLVEALRPVVKDIQDVREM